MNVNWTGVFRRLAIGSARAFKRASKPAKPGHSDPLAPLGRLSLFGAVLVAIGATGLLIGLATATLVIPTLGVQP